MPRSAQRVERAEAVIGCDPGAAAALLTPEPCVRADEGERRRALQGKERALVLEQHAAAGGGAADHGPGIGIVGRRLRDRRAGRLRPLDQREDALDGGIELGLLDLAVGERRPQLVPALQRRPGHLDVEPGPQRLDGAVVAEPVADDDAVEAPVTPQHLGQQPLVVGAVGPVEPVVRAHHGAHVALVDGRLEGHQVELAQRALVDLRRDRHALELGLVGDEVLDAAGHAFVLHAAHVGDGEGGRQHRVLAGELEVAAADRGPMQVDRGGQEDVGVLRVGLAAERPSDVPDEAGVPGGAERGAAREGRRRRAGPRRAPHAGRAVGHPHRRHRRVVEAGGVPGIGPSQQRHLLVQREISGSNHDARP